MADTKTPENSTRISIRLSETRSKLNALAAKPDDLTDAEQREQADLAKQLEAAEVELRAALSREAAEKVETTETQRDGEARERAELRGKARLGRYVRSALNGRPFEGAEREYADAVGVDGPGMVPLQMLGATTEERVEERARRRAGSEARAVTPAPADAELERDADPITPAVFDRSVAGWLGISMPTASPGIKTYPVLTSNVGGGFVAESASASETAGAITPTDADPRRLAGSFRIRKEDMAKLEDLETALQNNLSMVLSDELDKAIINGTGVSPQLNGLLQQMPDPSAPASGVETYARYQTAFSSHLDGLYATAPSDIRILMGPHTARHMLGVYRANEDSMTAWTLLSQLYGGGRITRRIADPASGIQQAIIARMNPMGDRIGVAPVWSAVEIIRDPYSAAPEGEVVVTATSLVGGVVLLRPDVFVQDSFRVSV